MAIICRKTCCGLNLGHWINLQPVPWPTPVTSRVALTAAGESFLNIQSCVLGNLALTFIGMGIGGWMRGWEVAV